MPIQTLTAGWMILSMTIISQVVERP